MSRPLRVTDVVIVGLLIAVSGAAISWCWPRPQSQDRVAKVREPDKDVFERRVASNPGYLGPQACVACHAKRVAEFQETRHFLACTTPKFGSMPPEHSSGQYSSGDPGLRFEMTRSGDDFFQTAIQITPSGEERTTSQIGLVYGDGAGSDEVYFSWHNDQLRELPVSWLHSTRQWGASALDPHAKGSFSREMLPRCLECHNTWFEHVVGTLNQYNRDSFIMGVTCEKCHGPGREHVSFHQAHPDSKTAAAITHPGRLSRERLMDLCAQCHSNAIKYRQPPLSYRPGEPLDAYFKTLDPKYPEEDRVANQTEYLRQSQCFQKSETLTCITCHDPHQRSGSSSLSPSQRSCLKCHKSEECREQDRLPMPMRDDCVACHMPQVNKIQVYFRTEDDSFVSPVKRYEHRIAVYPEARDELLIDWHRKHPNPESPTEVERLTTSLGRHWEDAAERRVAEYRFLAAIDAYRNALRFNDAPVIREKLDVLKFTHQKIDSDWFEAVHLVDEHHHEEALGILRQILRINPELARAHGRLGTVYATLGQEENAIESLKTAAACDPDDPYGDSMLGWLAILRGRPNEALDYYQRAVEAEPSSAKIRYQMGLALAQLKHWPDAIDSFQQVLSLEPNHAHGCQGLSHALRQNGHSAEALPFALRAARLTQFEDPYVLVSLAETYLDVGRHADATTTLAKASQIAKARVPQLLPQIRKLQATLPSKSH